MTITYQPTTRSVKAHPLPGWYDDAKFGIFVHWGIYSVPAFAPKNDITAEEYLDELRFDLNPYAEWYQNSLRIEGSPVHQHHRQAYGPDFAYEQFAPLFNEQIQAWDPGAWAELFARAGARYVVLVTKHHDGFLMWPSRFPNPRLPGWQASRDVTGELTAAINRHGLKMGLYYSSLLDWSFTQAPITSLPELIAGSETSQAYADYVESHWLELIERYDPWILWGDIGAPPGLDLPRLFAHYYNHKPEGVVNDRWVQLPRLLFTPLGRWLVGLLLKGIDHNNPPPVTHSDVRTPEYTTRDRMAQKKWETCRGIGNSFAYNQLEDGSDYETAPSLIRTLADIVSKNGNLLLNVGPDASGGIHPAQVAALEGIGQWLAAHGEAIYDTRPYLRFQDESGCLRYTTKGGALYAIVVDLPAHRTLSLPVHGSGTVALLETGAALPAGMDSDRLTVRLPAGLPEHAIPVIKIE